MKVNIRNVVDHGHKDERIVLDVIADTDIGNYLIMDTTYTDSGNVSNKVRHPYWFPDQKVKKGDTVVLYTRKGTYNTKTKSNGTTSHFFYWGLNNNVWNDEGDIALLFHIDNWQASKVPGKK